MKTVKDSYVETNEIVQPGDLNINNTLFGGHLVALVDKIAAISAFKHCDMPCVTHSIDHLSFKKSVPQGSLITLRASVNRVFKSSMEVGVKVTMRYGSWGKGETHVCSAYLTFVALSKTGEKAIPPQIEAETPTELRRYKHAKLRREMRLKLQDIYQEIHQDNSNED